MSPSPSCRQILSVASGMIGCASAVTIRNASAAVYSTVASCARESGSFSSASDHGSDERPQFLQRTRKVEVVELFVELLNGGFRLPLESRLPLHKIWIRRR